jgi:hypothetical protein
VTMSMRTTRIVTVSVLFLGLFAGLITLAIVGRGGAISPSGKDAVVRYLLEFFVPLIGVAVAFYLAGRGQATSAHRKNVPSVEAVALALFILASWCSVPALSLALSSTYEMALAYVDSVKLYGHTLATTAAAFAFAKSSR